MRPRVVVPVVARPCLAALSAALLTLSGCDRDSPLTPDQPRGYVPQLTTSTVPNLKVAFIGDQGDGPEAIAVLQLIRDEGADLVLHQGDFDYGDNPTAWDDLITGVLGAEFPYFASVGNHDDDMFYGPGGYQEKLQQRLDRVTGAACSGDLGVNSACHYQGLFFILSGVGTLGSEHETYIREQLTADNSTWRICSWHKNQNAMQLGEKGDEVGWGPYEACRELGAIVATAHEHTYERTKTLINTEQQQVDPSWPDPASLRVAPGATFVFVSGIGGASIRNQDRCLPTTYPYGCNGEWASVYTSDQNAQFGALFIEFHVDGDANKARGYFKNIDREIVDEFTVTSGFLTGAPNADFSSTEDPLLNIGFSDLSTDSDGTLVAWSWDFGDGETSADQSPTHVYSAAGVYEVTLTVTDDDGLTGARTKSVTAGPQPTMIEVRVAASSDDAEERASGKVSMTSSDLELVFDGSDQTVGMRFNTVTIPHGAMISNAHVQFTVDETHSVATSLIIQGAATDNATTFVRSDWNISSRARTAAAVSWSPAPWTTVGEAGADQQTPNIASIIEEIVNLSGWSSGNSVVIIITGTGERAAESFDGTTSTAPLLHVEYSTEPNITPTAGFTHSCTYLDCNFTDTSRDSDGTLAAWSWDFGDGGTSTARNPTHTYAAEGDHTVTLTVTDNYGATATASQVVSVTAPPNHAPTASFLWSATNLTVDFTDTSSDPDGTVTSWDWSFGDGGSSAEQNPTHTYAAEGDYTVTLTVTDNDGATGTTTQSVSVTAPANQSPTASFSWLATDLSVLFTDGSSDPDGTVTSWDWSFGDGGSSTERNPSHTYAAAGDYTVTLTVTDNEGITDTFSEVVTVSEPPAVVTLSEILPSTMVEGSSINITITGSGFAPGATVTFENGNGPAPNAADVVVVDENTITATVTAKNGGPPRDRLWDVRVSNADGSSGVLVGGLTVRNK